MELQKQRFGGTIQPNMIPLMGTIVVGAAGAITTQTGNRNCGVTFVKNATAGRYDATIHRGYKRYLGGSAHVQTPTAGGVMVVTDGNTAYLTGISAANADGTSPLSTFTIQCQLPTGVATATDVKSGDIISWIIWVSDSP